MILIDYYLNEIKDLYKHKHNLSLIILCGVLCELIARDKANIDGSYSSVISYLLKNHKISPSEHSFFDEVRIIRNKYIHISNDKLLQNYGDAVDEPDGTITFLEEKVRGGLEKDEFSRLYVQNEADRIYSDTYKLLSVLKIIK